MLPIIYPPFRMSSVSIPDITIDFPYINDRPLAEVIHPDSPTEICMIYRSPYYAYNPYNPWIAIGRESDTLLSIGSTIRLNLVEREVKDRGLGVLRRIHELQKDYVVFLVAVDPQRMFSAIFLAIPIHWVRLPLSWLVYFRLCHSSLPATIPIKVTRLVVPYSHQESSPSYQHQSADSGTSQDRHLKRNGLIRHIR